MISIIDNPFGDSPAAGIAKVSAHFVGRELRMTSDPFPAEVSGEYRDVEKATEAPWLQAILGFLPALLPSLTDSTRSKRLLELVELTCPPDWRLQNGIQFSVEGHLFTEEFMRTVPLLTVHEVREQMAPFPDELWSQLMTLTYDGQTFYLADQFDEKRILIPVCQQLVSLFKSAAGKTDWDFAMWWVNPTGWLDDASPRQVYMEDPEGVVDAARQELLKNEC